MMLIAAAVLLSGVQSQIPRLEASVKRRPTAAGYRRLADMYVATRQYGKATDAFDHASAMYGKLGDPNAAKVLADNANRYRTTIRMFVDRPTGGPTLAKFEPSAGCYLGVNIEREDETRDPQTFNDRIGKRHAMFFMYRRYGVPFPRDFARQLGRAHAALQIALEPNSYGEVRDDDYLREFAEDARRSGIPIFLRFASEMNGDWTPYHRDPAAYVRMFRLVSRVVREIAPNVAMVWCPNEIPQDTIGSYYPGPDAVDWVGVNFYSVIYNDADRSRPAEWRHPEDAIDYIYRRYSAQHPIMVGEWAATHLSSVDRQERPDFARTKIAQFYGSIPRLYPRLKAVSWLSMDTIRYATPGRQLNNYSLFDNPSVADAYASAVKSPYFLEEVGGAAPAAPQPLGAAFQLAQGERVSFYVRTYESNPQVSATFDGKPLANWSEASEYSATLPEGTTPGKHTISVEVRDRGGRVAGRQTMEMTIR